MVTESIGDLDEAVKLAGRGFEHTKYDTVDKVDLKAISECTGNATKAAFRF